MIKKSFHLIHHHQIFFLSFIIVFFLTIIGLNPVDLGNVLSSKIGMAESYSTGASVSIQPNPYNTLALQLREKQAGLDDREKILGQRESDLQKVISGQNKVIIGLGIGILLLFCLVIANYYLDYKRRSR